jgi:hypothetical protein
MKRPSISAFAIPEDGWRPFAARNQQAVDKAMATSIAGTESFPAKVTLGRRPEAQASFRRRDQADVTRVPFPDTKPNPRLRFGRQPVLVAVRSNVSAASAPARRHLWTVFPVCRENFAVS